MFRVPCNQVNIKNLGQTKKLLEDTEQTLSSPGLPQNSNFVLRAFSPVVQGTGSCPITSLSKLILPASQMNSFVPSHSPQLGEITPTHACKTVFCFCHKLFEMVFGKRVALFTETKIFLFFPLFRSKKLEKNDCR